MAITARGSASAPATRCSMRLLSCSASGRPNSHRTVIGSPAYSQRRIAAWGKTAVRLCIWSENWQIISQAGSQPADAESKRVADAGIVLIEYVASCGVSKMHMHMQTASRLIRYGPGGEIRPHTAFFGHCGYDSFEAVHIIRCFKRIGTVSNRGFVLLMAPFLLTRNRVMSASLHRCETLSQKEAKAGAPSEPCR